MQAWSEESVARHAKQRFGSALCDDKRSTLVQTMGVHCTAFVKEVAGSGLDGMGRTLTIEASHNLFAYNGRARTHLYTRARRTRQKQTLGPGVFRTLVGLDRTFGIQSCRAARVSNLRSNHFDA